MKVFKRNAVIITVVLFVCVAAYLNWSYTRRGNDAETLANSGSKVEETAPGTGGAKDNAESSPKDNESGSLFYQEDGEPADGANISEYFATARLNREKARDSAAETLAAVSATEGASGEVIDAALAEISALAATSEKEAELEMLIMAKGFADCVVFISEDGIKVTVPAPLEGLSTTSVAQITDTVMAETEFAATQLKIIPVK